MTPLHISTVLNSVISNHKKTGKRGSCFQKSKSADKYYQTAKPDKFFCLL